VAIQRLLILDDLPILLSSGCEFRSCGGRRVVAASLCEAWRRPYGGGYKDLARDTRASPQGGGYISKKRHQNKNALSDFFRQGVLRGILF
jgi:hypothetical protein